MDGFMFSGLGTALVTPFKNGEVDYQAYRNLVTRQIEAGVDYLVPLGTTAETPCLEDEEKIRLLELTAEYAKGRPVLVGTGTNSLKGTVKNMRLLEKHGADAFLVVVPYYNKPTQEGQYAYFKAVAQETDKPVLLYNVPGRTGANMSAETALRLAEIDNIVGIKEASGDLEQVKAVIDAAPEGFAVLSGNDDQTLDIMRMGGAGIISVVSNALPQQMADFVAAIKAGDTAAAEQWNARLMPMFRNCFVESNPMPVKAAMASMGLIDNELRLPLVPCKPETYDLMVQTLSALLNEVESSS